MKILKYLLFIFILLGADLKANDMLNIGDKSNVELFSQYINKFQFQSLPLKLDRGDVVNLSKDLRGNPYIELEKDFYRFIPKEILLQYPNSGFRAIFLLPEWNDKTVVLISQDILDEDLQRLLKTYLIVYEKTGTLIDYVELSGYILDFEESIMEITQDYTLKRVRYVFIDNVEEVRADWSILMQVVVFEYNLCNNGKIREIKKQTSKGYYNYNSEDKSYYLVKIFAEEI